MQVIGVGRVVIGREHGGVAAAGRIADRVEEGGCVSRPGPAAADRDAASVGEHEGTDVNRVASGVFAPRLAARDAPATGRAEVLDPGDAGAIDGLCGGLHAMFEPPCKARIHRAGRLWPARCEQLAGQDLAILAAALARSRRGQRGCRDVTAFEERCTDLSVATQLCELGSRCPARRIGQRQRRPWVVLRMIGEPRLAEQPKAEDRQRRDREGVDGQAHAFQIRGAAYRFIIAAAMC